MHVDRCAPKAYQWFKDVPYYKAIYNCSLVACYICILETIWRRMFLLCFVISLLKRTPKELTMRNVLQVVYVPGKDFTIMQRPQFFFYIQTIHGRRLCVICNSRHLQPYLFVFTTILIQASSIDVENVYCGVMK